MIILKGCKSDAEGVKRLYRYLYDLETDNDDLLEIYEEIDLEVSEIESGEYDLRSELGELEEEVEEFNEMKREIRDLIKDKDILSKDEFVEELERIIF